MPDPISAPNIPEEASPTRPLAISVNDPDGTPEVKLVDLNSQYEAVKWATDFAAVAGSPSLSNIYRRPVWLFDASALEIVVGSFETPPGWATYDVEFWWMNAGAGSGNVQWYIARGTDGEGDTLSADLTNTFISPATAGAQNQIVVTTAATGVAAVPGERVSIGAFRFGSDGGDTLANDAALLGIRMTRAS